MSKMRWVHAFGKGEQVLVLIKITQYVTYVIFCVNTYISETHFQHVVWVGCSSAHIKVLVLTHYILDLDNLQMVTSSWFEQIHKWNTFSTCSVSGKSSVVHNKIKSEWYIQILCKNHFGITCNNLIWAHIVFYLFGPKVFLAKKTRKTASNSLAQFYVTVKIPLRYYATGKLDLN
jgi:hypothetical protein